MLLCSLCSLTAAGLCAALVLGTVSAYAAAPEQFPGLDAKWREYRSPNFELYSRASDGFSRELLQNLEVARATFYRFFDLQPARPTAVSVYVFRSNEKFRAYAGSAIKDANYRLLAEYRVYPDRDVIALGTDEGWDMVSWIIYSNLAKILLIGAAGHSGPSWLSQGVSMFFGTFEPGAKTCTLGEADSFRRRLVGENPKIDVAELFQVQEGLAAEAARNQDRTNIFHAQAWALAHYWYCGQTEVPPADVNRFVRFMLQRGVADDATRVREKFEEIFKIDYAEMSRRVSRYVRSARFRSKIVPTPVVPARETYTSRALDVLETRERLAELLLRGRRDPVAKFVLIEALSGPRAARAAEALGTEAAADQNDDQAQEFWVRAIAAGTDNARVLDLVARMSFARWFGSFDFYFRLPEEKAAFLRDVLTKCIARAPEAGEYYEMLAWVESAAPQPSIPNVNRVQEKFSLVPHRGWTVIALALVRARIGERGQALELLQSLDRLQPTPSERRLAEQVREILAPAEDTSGG